MRNRGVEYFTFDCMASNIVHLIYMDKTIFLYVNVFESRYSIENVNR